MMVNRQKDMNAPLMKLDIVLTPDRYVWHE